MSRINRSNSSAHARRAADSPSCTANVVKPCLRRPFSMNAVMRASSSATRIRPLTAALPVRPRRERQHEASADT